MNPVTAAHIHLILCHTPIMAILVALALLIIGLWRGNPGDQKIALLAFVATAVLTLILYLTGKPATATVRGLPEFADTILERHQSTAALSVASCGVLGIIALAGLLLFEGKTVALWLRITILFVAVIVGLILVWTSNLGGQIRHSEIRSAMSGAPTDVR